METLGTLISPGIHFPIIFSLSHSGKPMSLIGEDSER